MPLRPPKLFLTALALLLGAGAVFAASHMTLRAPSAGATQHGLASQASTGGQDAAQLAALSEQANSAAPAGKPFALMPPAGSPLAPDFTLTTLDNKPVKLSDAVKKGPVLLDFWATWCGPCQMEMPELGTIYANYKARGVQIYGIDANDSRAQIQRFFKNASPGYPMLPDSGGIVATTYNISGIPALFLIDTSGRVRSVSVGFDPNTQADLPSSLDQLLAEHPQKTT